jgi:sulfide:quinone oxidoreductase
MAHVVVIGAGLGGLPTAYELRQLLPSQHRVALISEHAKFTFIPGLVRVALDIEPLDHFQLDLDPLAQRRNFVSQNTISIVNPEEPSNRGISPDPFWAGSRL